MASAARILKDVKHAARHKYAWPGGYPLLLVMSEGEVLCTDCARSEFRAIASATISRSRDGWRCEGVQIHWEGPPHSCAHCNAQIESAYGDPDADEAETV
jgi:hypothetical protein